MSWNSATGTRSSARISITVRCVSGSKLRMRFQRVAEEIEPHRQVHAGGEQVEDAAAHRVVAELAHRRGAVEAVELEPADHALHAEHVAGRGRQRLLADQVARRHALQRGVDRGEQHRGLLAALDAGEPRQRGHALRDDGAVRRHAVVGQAVPGRELQHLDVGREERQRARQRRHPRSVAADHQRARRRRIGPRRDRAGEIGNDQAFGAVGDVGQRQRPVGRQQFGGRLGRHFRHRLAPVR